MRLPTARTAVCAPLGLPAAPRRARAMREIVLPKYVQRVRYNESLAGNVEWLCFSWRSGRR